MDVTLKLAWRLLRFVKERLDVVQCIIKRSKGRHTAYAELLRNINSALEGKNGHILIDLIDAENDIVNKFLADKTFVMYA